MQLKNPDFTRGSGTAKRHHFWFTSVTATESVEFTQDGDTISYTIQSGDTNDEVVDGVVAAWNASGALGQVRRTAYDAQEDSYTIGGTIVIGDIFTITVGVQSVSFTTTTTSTSDCADGLRDAINNSELANFKDFTASTSGSVVKFWDDATPGNTWTSAGTTDSTAGTITLSSLQVVAIIADLPGIDFGISTNTPATTVINDSVVVAHANRTVSEWTTTGSISAVQDQSHFPYSGEAHTRFYSVKTMGGGAAGSIYQDVARSKLRRGIRDGKVIQVVAHWKSDVDIAGGDNVDLELHLMSGSTKSQTDTTSLTVTSDTTWQVATAELTVDTATNPDLDAVRVELHNDSSAKLVWFDSISVGYKWEPTAANGGRPQRWDASLAEHGFKQMVTAGGWASIYTEHEFTTLRAEWLGLDEDEWYTVQDTWEDCRAGRPFSIWLDRDASSIETDEVKRFRNYMHLGQTTDRRTRHSLGPGETTIAFSVRGRSIIPVE